MSSGNGSKPTGGGKDFVPVNDLEKKLARISTGRTTLMKAFNFLMNSMIVVLVRPGGEEEKARDLTLRGPAGKPYFPVFSSPQRAMETMAHHKAYTQLENRPGWQTLSALPPDRGLIVNPGAAVGFTVSPEELLKLRKKFRI